MGKKGKGRRKGNKKQKGKGKEDKEGKVKEGEAMTGLGINWASTLILSVLLALRHQHASSVSFSINQFHIRSKKRPR